MMSMGAWATVTMPTLTTDTNNPTYYIIQSVRSGKYANYAGASAQLTQVESASAGVNALWYFVKNGDDNGVSIVPAAASDLKLATTSSATAEGSVWYLLENPYNAGTFCVSLASDATADCWDDQGGHTTIGYWQPSGNDYQGTSWNIVEMPVSKAEVDAGTVNMSFALTKLDVLARLAPLASLSVYTDNIAAVKNAADEIALNAALQLFNANISLLCRSGKYLVVGETGGEYVTTPSEYNHAIQLESAGFGTFYLKGYKSEKYMGNVTKSTAIGTDETPTTAFYFQTYNGYTVVRPSDTASSDDGYRYIHNGGSGCVGWEPSAANTQHTMAEVTLPAAFVNVKYHLMVNGVDKAQETVEQGVGDAPSVPKSFNYDFTTYKYDVQEITANTTDVYATAIFNMPFETSTDFNTATWYYMNGHASYSDRYISTNEDAIAWAQGMERTDAYKWAFIGNPIEGIKVINKAAGTGKYLMATNPASMGETAQSWTLKQQTETSWQSGEKGFGLYDASLTYLNTQGSTLKYWSNFDQGSTFWVGDVDAVTSDKNLLAEAIAAAEILVANAGVPGYPTASAGESLNTKLTSAKSVYNNASGDYVAAYNSLTQAITEAASNVNYTPRTDVYYTIVNARGAMVYDPSHSSSVDATNDNAEYLWYGSTTPDDTNPNNLWGFIEKEGNYYMYNVGKKQFASVGTGGYGPTWIFSNTPAYITLDDGIADEITIPRVRIRATIATTGNSYTMSVSTNYTGPVITYDANGDGGVPMTFAEVNYAIDSDVTAAIEALLEDLTPYRNALKDMIDGCDDLNIGTGVNQYASNEAYETALAAAEAVYNDDNATKTDMQTAISNLESAIAGLSLNMPTAGFYRIKGKTSGTYLAAGNASNGKFNMSTATDATTIFYYSGTILTSFGSGMSNGMSSNSWEWVLGENASEVEFQDGLTNGGYGIKSSDANFYDNGDNGSADRGREVAISANTNARYTKWYLEEVTELPITLNSAGDGYYATLYLPVDATITNADAFTIKVNEAKNAANTTQLEDGKVPANTAVLLKGTSGTATATVNTNDTFDSTTSDLSGTLVAVNANGSTDYFLGKNGNQVGFYHWSGSVLKGFRAYLPADKVSGTSAKGFTLVFDEATGINTIENGKWTIENENVYNLQGQKVNRAQKGVYIVNGKKVVMK